MRGTFLQEEYFFAYPSPVACIWKCWSLTAWGKNEAGIIDFVKSVYMPRIGIVIFIMVLAYQCYGKGS